MEANERMKVEVVEFENRINQGLRNHQAGDVKAIEEDKTEPIPTMPNPNPINSNSSTISPSLKDCIVHIPYTNAKTFADDVLLNHVGDKELKTLDGVGTGRMTKKEKDDNGTTKELNKEWKLNEKRLLVTKFIIISDTQLKFPI
ncbi:hypothetical protein Tco_0016453 [Tanacetum coccineum]